MINDKKLKILDKIINHLTKNGEKIKAEKLILKVFKNLQKLTKKSIKFLIQLLILKLIPIFKLNKLTLKKKNKKIVKYKPYFITNHFRRISLAIKFITKNIRHNNSKMNCYTLLQQEILNNKKNKNNLINYKKNLHEQVLIYKHFFRNYKW